MPQVRMTTHLYRFFPQLEGREIRVPAGSVKEALNAVDQIAPGFSDYLLDERGRVRPHVNLSIDNSLLVDRKTLSDQLPEGATLFVFQALSGG